MLDLHALVNATGSATLVDISIAANIPANDGQSAAGVPIAPGAILKGWGFKSLAAGVAIEEAQLISQDQIDPINGEHWVGGASSVLLCTYFDAYLPFIRGKRALYYAQDTAADIAGFTIDKYPTPGGADVKTFGQRIILPQVFGGALTANVWGTQIVAPANMIPAGKYALLGAYVHSMTDGAIIRFVHADFQGKKPGFPVMDPTKAVARAVIPMGCSVFNMYGMQFMALGDIPVFNCTVQGTGLSIEMLDMVADTPQVNLHLVQLA